MRFGSKKRVRRRSMHFLTPAMRLLKQEAYHAPLEARGKRRVNETGGRSCAVWSTLCGQ